MRTTNPIEARLEGVTRSTYPMVVYTNVQSINRSIFTTIDRPNEDLQNQTLRPASVYVKSLGAAQSSGLGDTTE